MEMKKYFLILNLLLATAAVYMGVQVFYKVLEAKLDPVSPEKSDWSQSSSWEPKKPPQFSHYSAILDRNLFKVRKQPAIEAIADKPQAIENLKQTSLKLKLWGTALDDSGKAFAVIEDPENKEQGLFRAGDAIQNASVKTILREKIVLTVGGMDEILNIESREAQRTGRQQLRASAPSGAESGGPETQKIVLHRDQLVDSLQNISDLMKQARIRPHFRDGKPDGLMLTGIRPESIFRKMGLNNGDILVGINEGDIRSVDDALRFYQDLKSTSSAKLQIRRRGQLRMMDYNIQ
jgi:general secretion pathway protein C